MIISQTPYRISFFGGGTDYPTWFRKNEGQVISTSIDKYLYISCRYLPPFFQHKIRLVYGKIELGKSSRDLKHVSARAVLNYMGVMKNIEIHYDGDLPARSGIGSSSAFTVGLLNTISAYKKTRFSKKNLSKKSIYIEQKVIKENVGSQDQICTSYGGLNHIKFSKNSEFTVKKINISKKLTKKLEKNTMLFHTGKFRTAENITKNYVNTLDKKSTYLYRIYEIVDEAKKYLEAGNLVDFAKLLNETWNMKKKISKTISNSYIDDIYSLAINNGAIGGKLLGAGGGGFIMFYVPQNKQSKVRKALSKFLYIPFKFESKGSQIIYNQI